MPLRLALIAWFGGYFMGASGYAHGWSWYAYLITAWVLTLIAGNYVTTRDTPLHP